MNDYYEYLLFIWPVGAKHISVVYLCSKDDMLRANAVWITENAEFLLKTGDRLLPYSCYSGHVTGFILFITLLYSILPCTVNVEAQNNFVEEVFLLYTEENRIYLHSIDPS